MTESSSEETVPNRDSPPANRTESSSAETVPDRASLSAKTDPIVLEARVLRARNMVGDSVEHRARALAQPAIEEYFQDRIDEMELKNRKNAANERARVEHWALNEIEAPRQAYVEAFKARQAAEQALAKASENESELFHKVDEMLRKIEQQ